MPEGAAKNLSSSALWWSLCALAACLWLPAIFGLHRADLPFLANLFPGGPPFDDLYSYSKRISLLGTPLFYVPSELPPVFAYPPAAAYLFKLLYALHHETRLLAGLCCGFLAATCVSLAGRLPRSMRPGLRAAVGCSLLLFSYPVIFLAQRGNIEIVIGLLTFFALLLARGRAPLSAAVLLGIAASIKPFPILFFGIFLSRRPQWKALVAGLATLAAVTLLALWCAGPSVPLAAQGFARGLTSFEKHRAGVPRWEPLIFDHSLFSPVKLFAVLSRFPLRPLLTGYYVFALIFLVYGAWRVSSLDLLNRMAFYTVMVVALPPVSFEYTLVNCYALLVLLAASLWQTQHLELKGRVTAWWSLLLLLAALLPFTLDGNGRVGVGGQMVAGLLMAIALLSLHQTWRFDVYSQAA